MSDETTLNVKGLEQLVKALKSQPPKTRVGVLGEKVPRTDSNSGKHQPNNAEVGAVHEFGAPARGIPARSFLRVPISENLDKEMENAGALDKDVMADVIRQGTLIPWMRKIAVLAEKIVADAFSSGGFGKWPAWKTPGYTNNTGQILVDTQQLRNSITSEVKE